MCKRVVDWQTRRDSLTSPRSALTICRSEMVTALRQADRYPAGGSVYSAPATTRPPHTPRHTSPPVAELAFHSHNVATIPPAHPIQVKPKKCSYKLFLDVV